MTRRTFLSTSAGLTSLALATRHTALAGAGTQTGDRPMTPMATGTEGLHVMTAAEFQASRRFVETRFGRIAYVERGSGAIALFLHGLPLNGFHWRGAIARLSGHRRCLAPDFLGLGYTETHPDQDLAPATQADMIAAVLDAMSIATVDVVANDSGGAVAQLLAARHPARVRTLLLTNCDVHTNSPPTSLAEAMEAARQGVLADVLARHLSDKAFARSPEGLFSVCYANPSNLTDDAIDCYLRPVLSSAARRAQLHGYMLAFEPNPLPAIEPALKRCTAPARMVWGTADIHFDVSWADWLDRTFPQSRGVRRVQGAKLFFPEEMPDLIAEEALALWTIAP
jgi:haloalkane dehalogenase